MKTYQLNIVFDNQEACDVWEEQNIKDRKYNGESVFMVCHDSPLGQDKVTLTQIITV